MASADAAAEHLRGLLPPDLRAVEIGVICGSGLAGLAALVDPAARVAIPYADIPGFAVPRVAGHPGQLVVGRLGDRVCALLVGRFHWYEGHPLAVNTFPVRVLRRLGASTLVVTNAAGALNPSFAPGTLMVIKDHLNLPGLAGASPLTGPNDDSFGPRFPAMSDAYDPELRKAFFRAAIGSELAVEEGTYVFVAGPSYETRAECRMLRSMGADAVGMSTVPEVVVARHCGMRVFGLSLLTNPVDTTEVPGVKELVLAESRGQPVPEEPKHQTVNHEEVLDTANKVAVALQALMKKAILAFPRQ
ncbi:inosine/guanosine/xanthosine phosphorylase [Hyaloraphidium curvatum]|nr:inosine/guanosine/xanthosine phosphorylase [Hyaloraphidium curvatum]